MNEQQLFSRQQRSQRAFYRALARGSRGADLIQLEGIQATVVPVRPWFSIFNSTFYRGSDDLKNAHSALARTYESAGVKAWTVWAPPGDDNASQILRRRGHVLDSTPMLFAAPMQSLNLAPVIELELEVDVTWRLVAEINDRAHGVLEPWSMAAVFETMRDSASHLYVARHEGAPASGLIARELDGDCYFWFVATVPEARASGIASELLRHALREARERGCTSSTLESTSMAEAMYARLGYRSLGRCQMWERRTPA